MISHLLGITLTATLSAAQASTTLLSPRLATLSRDVQAGNRTAVAAFWDEVTKSGAPMVEPFAGPFQAQAIPLSRPPVPNTTRYALVTFLWRSATDARVVVVGPTLGWSVEHITLRRLGDTDVWYRSVVLPNDARFIYELSVNDPAYPFVTGDTVVYPAVTQADPLNPKRWEYLRPRIFSIAQLPDAPQQPWTTPGATRGTLVGFTDSLTSAMLGNRRRVLAYKPTGYSATVAPYPLVIVGASYINQMRLPLLLDHLIASGRIPPVVVAYVEHSRAEQHRETSCDEPFGRFLATEFLPYVQARLNVTKDPLRIILAGASAGGISAACAALEHPSAFGNVLSQSGAFWRSAPGDHEDAWFTRYAATHARENVRFFLSIGSLENGGPFETGGISMLHANRGLRDVLRARGYEVGYLEVTAGHDPLNWESTLANGLVFLLGPR